MIFQKIFSKFITFLRHYYFLYFIHPYTEKNESLIQLLSKENDRLKNQMNQLFIKNESFEENYHLLKYDNRELETKIIDLQKEHQFMKIKIESMEVENEKLQQKINKYKKSFANLTKKGEHKKTSPLNNNHSHLINSKNTPINQSLSLSGINNTKYGGGPLRYREGNIYYHGVGKNETQKWNQNNKFNHCIFEYSKGHSLSNPDLWDTYNVNDFCTNCSYNHDLSKGRRVVVIYQCNGHEI